jgi:hypothetical protein
MPHAPATTVPHALFSLGLDRRSHGGPDQCRPNPSMRAQTARTVARNYAFSAGDGTTPVGPRSAVRWCGGGGGGGRARPSTAPLSPVPLSVLSDSAVRLTATAQRSGSVYAPNISRMMRALSPMYLSTMPEETTCGGTAGGSILAESQPLRRYGCMAKCEPLGAELS